jgi:hypothetical protein
LEHPGRRDLEWRFYGKKWVIEIADIKLTGETAMYNHGEHIPRGSDSSFGRGGGGGERRNREEEAAQ